MAIVKIAEHFHISRQSVYNWRNAALRAGVNLKYIPRTATEVFRVMKENQ